MHKPHFCAALILLLILTATVMGQKPTLVISDDDKKPSIIGDLGTNLTSFSKTITVTLTGAAAGEAKALSFTRSDLKEAGGKAVIDRNSIAISAVSLLNDKPQDIVITVSNITRPATYTAEIAVWVEPNRADAQVLNLTVVIKPKIDVKVSVPAKVQLVRCSPFPCSLTSWLPDRLLGQKRKFTLDNETAVDLPVSLSDLLLRGDKSGDLVTAQDVSLSVPNQRLDARKSTAAEITFPDTNKLQADHYAGTVRFHLDGYETQPTGTYILDVRDGPWWALLVILFGVIVGRLVKSMNSPEAITQLKLLRRLYRLQNKAAVSLKNDKDREALFADLDAIKERINAAEEPEAVLTAELDKIETRTNLLLKLERLQETISFVQNPVLKQELQAKCLNATQALRLGKIDDCLASIKAIEAKLIEAQASPQDADSESFAGLLDSVRDLSQEGARALEAHKVEPPTKFGPLARILALLSGINVLNAEVRYWLVRPLFFLLLLFLLVMVGLKTLYVDGGSNFGSEGFYDYLGLFMWGISADVIQTTLQSVRLPAAVA